MRWKQKQSPNPKICDSRWVRCFALFPVRMGSGYLQNHDGDLVWLEWFWSLESFLPAEGGHGEWTTVGGPTWTLKPWDLNDNPTNVVRLVPKDAPESKTGKIRLDYRTAFKVGDVVWTCGVDKLLGSTVRQEQVRIVEVKEGCWFKYRIQYLSDGEECLFMEDEVVVNLHGQKTGASI